MKLKFKYSTAALLAAMALGITVPAHAADDVAAPETTNITNITINNIAEGTGLELGTDARARGQGSIATGKNSLAIGKNAVATGGNETQASINAKLGENKKRLQDIADAEANSNRLLNELQTLRRTEADVIEAGERVKQVRKTKQTAYERYQTSKQTYNDAVAGAADFLREAQAKIDDLNSRLTGVSQLTDVNINSDEGLTSAATQLKQIAEQGTTLDLSVDFYKDYVSSYYQALGELRLNELISSKSDSETFNSKDNANINEVTRNPYNNLNLLDKLDYGVYKSNYGLSFFGDDQIFKVNVFDADSSIILPKTNLVLKNIATTITSEQNYIDAQESANAFKLAFKNYFEKTNDPFSTDEVKTAILDKVNKKIDYFLKTNEITYYQGQYETTKDTTWLDKKANAIKELNQLKNEFNKLTSPKNVKIRVLNEWRQENIVDIKEKNKVTTDTLTSELEKALGINKNAVKDKEAEIARLKQAMEQALNTYNNTNPSAADLALSQRYEAIMAELTAKSNALKAEQERLNALKAALTLHDLTNVGENALAIGTNALTTGTNAMAIGTSAVAVGENAIAIGKESAVTGNNSIAIGVGHIVIGNNAGTFGDPNTIYGDNSYAIGNNNTIGDANTPNTVGTNTFVLGNNVTTTANNAVILGNNSTATADNVVSVGASGSERKIINVAAGTLSETSTDAVNGSQLFNAMKNGGKTYTAGTNITISDTNVISATGTGTNTAGNTGLITGDTLNQVFNSITNTTNASLAGKADVDATNLTAAHVVSWQAKLGNGAIAEGNTGLVTGGTVFTAIDGVNSKITNLNTSKAETNLSNITNEGKTIIRNLAKESVKVVNGTNTTVTEGTDGEAKTYAVNVTNDAIKGAIQADLNSKADRNASNLTTADKDAWKAILGDGTNTAGDTGLITGDTLNTVINNITNTTNTNLATKADKDASNLTADDVKAWQGKLGNGQNAAGDTGLITGDTLHTAINSVNTDITNINTSLSTKANTNLNNITNEGKTIIRNLAKESVKVVNGTNTTVTEGTDGEVKTYAVNVTNDAIKGAIQADLDNKANIDASNLSNSNVSKWQEKLGTGQISEGNTGLVTGGTVYEVVKNVTGDSLVKTDGKVITIDNTGTATTIDVSHTVDGKTEGRVLTGVLTDVSNATSVVNVGTLTGALDAYGQNVNQHINSLDRKLSRDIGKAGAAAAALAALKPLSYDPGNKLNFAVGQGHYKGQNSTALGVFYTPNEDVQLNFGGTLTGSDKAINGGISFRIGSGNSEKKIVKTSEFNALKEQNKAMQEQLEALAKQVADLQKHSLGMHLSSEKAPFPDVPADHWANEAVETLHGNDVLEGYPDGEFKGDKTMSRYEYAQMLYKAAKK